MAGSLRDGVHAAEEHRHREHVADLEQLTPRQASRGVCQIMCFSYFTAINEICSSPGYVSSFRGERSIGASCATVVRAGGISEKYCA